MSELVTVRVDKPSGTIVLNRPERRNAINVAMIGQLQEAFDDLRVEHSVASIILVGSGDIFSAGSDLKEIDDVASQPDAMATWHQQSQDLKSLIETILRSSKPVIAAVNGPVMGLGLTLMLACDMVVAAQSATVGFVEPHRGLSYGMTTPLLAFRTGTATASRLLLSGDTIDCETAQSLNLFHEVVPDDMIWVKAQELATQCAAGARESHQSTKNMLNDTIGESMLTQLSIGAANLAALRTTDAAKEGIMAFLEKRKPKWD